MKFTFADSPYVDDLTFKKLLLLGTDLVFMDRASVKLEEYLGTVGAYSPFRNYIKEFDGSPIKLSVEDLPAGYPVNNYYSQYFEKDLDNPEFINILFEGIENGMITSYHFDQTKTKAIGEFKDYKRWLLSNKEEISRTNLLEINTPNGFEISNKHEAFYAFKFIVLCQSILVSSVLYTCNKYENSPICISPTLNKLISIRLSSSIYSGKTIINKQLGLKLMDCLIPDEALLQIQWQDILVFREKTKEYYNAWQVEIKKIEATLFKESQFISYSEALSLFDSEINPRLLELKNEIRRIRDDMYKSIFKTAKNALLSSCVTLGTLSPLSITGAILSFIAMNLKSPKITDDIIDTHFQLKDKELSHGLTYLLKIEKFVKPNP